MGALMHIEEEQVPATLSAMVDVLRTGAPLFIGLWGGELGDQIDEAQIKGERRLFSLRSLARNRELIETCGRIETATALDVGTTDWEYQGFLVRV